MCNEPTFVSDGWITRLHATSIQFARVADRRDWPIVPTAHKIFHYLLLARVINPKAVQNYGEEALIGTVTNTWKRSISGRMFKQTFPLSALSHCSRGLHFPLTHERSFWKGLNNMCACGFLQHVKTHHFNSMNKSFDLETSCSVGADIVGVDGILCRVSRSAYDPSSTQVLHWR